MNGAELRMGRLFDRESERSFITAFDRGTNLRVPPEVGEPLEVVENIVVGGIAFGRNFWRAEDPVRTAAPLREVVHGGVPVSRR